MKRLFTLILMAGAVPAFASQWVLLEKSAKNAVFVDVESIAIEPRGIVRLWVKTDFTPPVRAEGKTLDHKLVRWTIDCVGHRVAVGTATGYDVDGNVVIEVAGQDFRDVPPDSIAENVEKNVCNKPNA
ncbi:MULTISPECIES: surface-adhesin E family protein [Burkholderia cepacia complex]|uniref:surface-adhesin E family protein n=1 Tax=Burkholderia cepacia complex TaxID=87882 RepID=UPI001178BC0D|nr:MULTISPECIES: surface-adhesin E family protein [Burkholderia cepacia complex]MBJ9963673.1 hypothetical protein [Burkholderia seminalis]